MDIELSFSQVTVLESSCDGEYEYMRFFFQNGLQQVLWVKKDSDFGMSFCIWVRFVSVLDLRGDVPKVMDSSSHGKSFCLIGFQDF